MLSNVCMYRKFCAVVGQTTYKKMYIHISLSDQKQHQIHTLSIQQFEYDFVGMKTSERLLWNHRFSSLRWFKIVSIQKKKIESVEYRWTIEMNYETMCIRMICSSTDCNNSINYLLKQHCFKFCFERCRFEWTCYTRMENAQNRINHTDTDIDNMFFLQNFKIIRGWPCSVSSPRQFRPRVKCTFLIFGTTQAVICPYYEHVVTTFQKM